MNLSTLLSLGGGQKPRKFYSNYVPGSYSVTIPADVWFVIATIQAGGGAGGSGLTASFAGQGGASGFCLFEVPVLVTPGEVVPVVIGAGGLGANAAAGGDGGNTTLKRLVAKGGKGGARNASTTAQNGLTSQILRYDFSDAYLRYQLSACNLAVPLDVILPSITAKWHSSKTAVVAGTDDIVAAWGTSRGADYNDGGNIQTGGAPSAFVNGASANYTTPGAPLKGAGGGACSNGGYGGDGGPGFVELVYFSDSIIA